MWIGPCDHHPIPRILPERRPSRNPIHLPSGLRCYLRRAVDNRARKDGAMNREDCVLYSGAANGTEAEFGAAAERYGIEEVNYTFEGHPDARRRGIRVLTHA